MTAQAVDVPPSTKGEGHALAYLRLGFRTIPACRPLPLGGCAHHGPGCGRPGKVPIVRWQEFQTRAPALTEVQAWWRRWPTANVAAVCGVSLNDWGHLVALDVELSGLKALGSIELPVTATARSQSGGLHFWYLAPRALRSRRLEFHGVPFGDVRGVGGLATLPPSEGPRGAYQWLEGRAPREVGLAAAPGWLMLEPAVQKPLAQNLQKHRLVQPSQPPPAVALLPERVQTIYLNSYDTVSDRSKLDARIALELLRKDAHESVIQQLLMWPPASKAREKLHRHGEGPCRDYISRTIQWARRQL